MAQQVFELAFLEILRDIHVGTIPDVFRTLPANSRWDRLFGVGAGASS